MTEPKRPRKRHGKRPPDTDDAAASAPPTPTPPPSSDKRPRPRQWACGSVPLKGLLVGVTIGLLGGVWLAASGPGVPPPIVDLLKVLDPDGQLQALSASHLARMREMVSAMPSFAMTNVSLFAEELKPGLALAAQGYRARHPVIMVPGFVTTGLELWSGKPCAMRYFRQRMWGTLTMVQSMLLDSDCWMNHMALDPVTGLDPKCCKLRPAQGFEAADYFVPGYWVWGKLIENLALLGYDHNNMALMSYDWRLSPQMNEERDIYFTRLKRTVELMVDRWGQKAVVMAHSMGVNVFLYFIQWVESDEGGRGGPSWIEDHLEAFANLAGPVLGVPKAVSALLSGEMRDTANLGPLGPYLMGDVFSHQRRRKLFQTWYSLLLLAPKGGDAIWGSAESSPDDVIVECPTGQSCKQNSFGHVVRFADPGHPNLTMAAAMERVLATGSAAFRANVARWYSFGAAVNQKEASRFWTNPLEVALPAAPSLTIYCMYGIGLPTERAYHYKPDPDNASEVIIDFGQSDVNVNNGVFSTTGDGTVPLLSLGYMCHTGWRSTRYNPQGVAMKVREFAHQRAGLIPHPRGGATSADHIDIMGNNEFLTDLLTIAAGQGARLEERYLSNISAIAARVRLSADPP